MKKLLLSLNEYFKTKKFKAKIKQWRQITILTVLFALSFYLGLLTAGFNYSRDNHPNKTLNESVLKLDDVSIATNEQNELLIIRRSDKELTIYQDSVGIAIFWLYSNNLRSLNNK